MEFIHNPGQIALYDSDNRLLAEVTFPAADGATVNINHTFVDDSLRGQGIAGKLMEELVKELRSSDKKAVVTCPYAKKWFENHPECGDLLK